jgi:hypothetical protein
MHQPEGDVRPRAAWTDDQLRAGREGNQACLQCHPQVGGNLAAHTHHAPGSTGSECYNCHMPHTTYGLLKAIRSHQVSSPTVQSSLATGRPNACNQCHLDRTLHWAGRQLQAWYGIPAPELTAEEQTVAAGVLWTLKGDAGQRALMAWSMGWDAARQASGTDWMPAYLAPLLDDPYDAVRYIAQRSLKRLPGYAAFEYDFLGTAATRQAAAQRVMLQWRQAPRVAGEQPSVLLDARGQLRQAEFLRLLAQRNEQPVMLNE